MEEPLDQVGDPGVENMFTLKFLTIQYNKHKY